MQRNHQTNDMEAYMLDLDEAWLVYEALDIYADTLSMTREKALDLRRWIGNTIDPPSKPKIPKSPE